MNAVIIDSRHDQIKLNHISHESSQSGQGGDRTTSTRESNRNHSGGVGLRDEPAASDDSLSKAQVMIA